MLDWPCPQARAETKMRSNAGRAQLAFRSQSITDRSLDAKGYVLRGVASIRLQLVNCFTTHSQSISDHPNSHLSIGWGTILQRLSDPAAPSTTKVAEAEDSSISPPVNGINNNSHSVVNSKSYHMHTVQCMYASSVDTQPRPTQF